MQARTPEVITLIKKAENKYARGRNNSTYYFPAYGIYQQILRLNPKVDTETYLECKVSSLECMLPICAIGLETTALDDIQKELEQFPDFKPRIKKIKTQLEEVVKNPTKHANYLWNYVLIIKDIGNSKIGTPDPENVLNEKQAMLNLYDPQDIIAALKKSLTMLDAVLLAYQGTSVKKHIKDIENLIAEIKDILSRNLLQYAKSTTNALEHRINYAKEAIKFDEKNISILQNEIDSLPLAKISSELDKKTVELVDLHLKKLKTWQLLAEIDSGNSDEYIKNIRAYLAENTLKPEINSLANQEEKQRAQDQLDSLTLSISEFSKKRKREEERESDSSEIEVSVTESTINISTEPQPVAIPSKKPSLPFIEKRPFLFAGAQNEFIKKLADKKQDYQQKNNPFLAAFTGITLLHIDNKMPIGKAQKNLAYILNIIAHILNEFSLPEKFPLANTVKYYSKIQELYEKACIINSDHRDLLNPTKLSTFLTAFQKQRQKYLEKDHDITKSTERATKYKNLCFYRTEEEIFKLKCLSQQSNMLNFFLASIEEMYNLFKCSIFAKEHFDIVISALLRQLTIKLVEQHNSSTPPAHIKTLQDEAAALEKEIKTLEEKTEPLVTKLKKEITQLFEKIKSIIHDLEKIESKLPKLTSTFSPHWEKDMEQRQAYLVKQKDALDNIQLLREGVQIKENLIVELKQDLTKKIQKRFLLLKRIADEKEPRSMEDKDLSGVLEHLKNANQRMTQIIDEKKKHPPTPAPTRSAPVSP